MLKNYLKVALRNLSRHKGYNALNVAGLAIGMACCMFILLYVRDELSFDGFNEKKDRIYRITSEIHSEGRPRQRAALSIVPLATTLLQDYPAVEQAVRIQKAELFVSRGMSRFYENSFLYADDGFFDVFSFKLAKGDPQTALRYPYSVVLTSATALKYFGDEDPIGQALAVDDTVLFKVTGVVEPVPPNSHFSFDFLASFSTRFAGNQINTDRQFLWWSYNCHTYVLLKANASAPQLASELYDLGAKYIPDLQERFGGKQRYFLQPLGEIYLYSNLIFELGQTSDILYVYVFLIVAVLVLTIACINFINLSTARSVHRAREIGMRKTVGAVRGQIVRQLLAESMLTASLALILAVAAIKLTLPAFNVLTGKSLAINILTDPIILAGFLGVTVLAGLMAGSYPAFALSGSNPLKMIEGRLAAGTIGVFLRKVLVVFQFAASIILIIGTTVVFHQLSFMRERNVGFDKEQVLVIPMHGNEAVRTRVEAIKSALQQLPAVVSAASSSSVPGLDLPSIVFIPEGAQENETQSIKSLVIDYDFVATLGLEMTAGRAFSPEFPTDATGGFIINEATVDYLGWGTPLAAVGKELTWGWPGKKGNVVGVVKDFHHQSLQNRIEPLVMHIQPSWLGYISLKIETTDIRKSISALESTWQRLVPNRPFDSFFLDQNYDRQYRTEERLSNLFSVFSALAIFIGCLGLFSLAAFSAEQRTKEIGVRKVLGASVTNVVLLLSKDFVKLVAVANLVAWPVAWFAMNRWLEDFAYRVEIGWSVFAIAGTLALLIALITVSYQAIRASLANPVEALRYE